MHLSISLIIASTRRRALTISSGEAAMRCDMLRYSKSVRACVSCTCRLAFSARRVAISLRSASFSLRVCSYLRPSSSSFRPVREISSFSATAIIPIFHKINDFRADRQTKTAFFAAKIRHTATNHLIIKKNGHRIFRPQSAENRAKKRGHTTRKTGVCPYWDCRAFPCGNAVVIYLTTTLLVLPPTVTI